MTSLIRWQPLREIADGREPFDRLMEDAFLRPFSAALWEGSSPALDMYQTEDEVVVKMALPGVKPEDVQVSVSNGVLTVRGETKEEKEEKEKSYHLRARRYGTFSRSVALPIQANVDKAAADFENGVLTLTLPKAEEAKSKTITVKSKK
jgi:HSP20 family protein